MECCNFSISRPGRHLQKDLVTKHWLNYPLQETWVNKLPSEIIQEVHDNFEPGSHPDRNLVNTNVVVKSSAFRKPKPYLDTACSGVSIPVVLIVRNNPSLLKPLVEQLRSCFNATIIIFDNGSDFGPMIKYLLSLKHAKMITVIRSRKNLGSRGTFSEKKLKLPRFFALSDSDLRLNDNLPSNFLCVLAHMTQRLKVPKAGLALDLSDATRMWPNKNYYQGKSIVDYEDNMYDTIVNIRGWKETDNLVFRATVDTIFAVYDSAQMICNNESEFPCYVSDPAVRVGGVFSVKHRPWYPEIYEHWKDGEIDANFKTGKEYTVAALLRRNGAFSGNSSVRKKRFQLPKLRNYYRVDNIMSYRCSSNVGNTFSIPGKINLVKEREKSLLKQQNAFAKGGNFSN